MSVRSKLRQALVCPSNEREHSSLRAFWLASSPARDATVRPISFYVHSARIS